MKKKKGAISECLAKVDVDGAVLINSIYNRSLADFMERFTVNDSGDLTKFTITGWREYLQMRNLALGWMKGLSQLFTALARRGYFVRKDVSKKNQRGNVEYVYLPLPTAHTFLHGSKLPVTSIKKGPVTSVTKEPVTSIGHYALPKELVKVLPNHESYVNTLVKELLIKVADLIKYTGVEYEQAGIVNDEILYRKKIK
jgi:hypothetical protein